MLQIFFFNQSWQTGNLQGQSTSFLPHIMLWQFILNVLYLTKIRSSSKRALHWEKKSKTIIEVNGIQFFQQQLQDIVPYIRYKSSRKIQFFFFFYIAVKFRGGGYCLNGTAFIKGFFAASLSSVRNKQRANHFKNG